MWKSGTEQGQAVHEGKVEQRGRALLVKSRQIARQAAAEELGGPSAGEGAEVVCEVRLIGVAGGMSDLGKRKAAVPQMADVLQPRKAAERFGRRAYSCAEVAFQRAFAVSVKRTMRNAELAVWPA